MQRQVIEFAGVGLHLKIRGKSRLFTAEFHNSAMPSSTFTHVDMTNSTISNANLSGLAITDSNIKGMTIDGIPVADAIKAYNQAKEVAAKAAAAGPGMTPISTLQLGVRCLNVLRNEGITSAQQLAGTTRSHLLRNINFGRRSLTEIEEALEKIGLKLKEEG